MNELNVDDFGSNHLGGSDLHLNDLGVGDWSSNKLQLANSPSSNVMCLFLTKFVYFDFVYCVFFHVLVTIFVI